MAIFSNSLIPAAAAAEPDVVTKSVRFNRADTPALVWSPSSSGDRRKWTSAFWMKRSDVSNGHQYLFGCSNFSGNDGIAAFYLEPADTIETYYDTSGTNYYRAINDRLYRDTAGWMHVIWAVNAYTPVERVWINGVEETLTNNNVVSGFDYGMNKSGNDMRLGVVPWETHANSFNGYLAQFVHLDGQYITDPTEFGQFSETSGEWTPKELTSSSFTYGTNGALLLFNDDTVSSTSFIDSSSNGLTVTANGGVAHSETQKKIGDSSIAGGGTTGDYLSLDGESGLAFGAVSGTDGDYTIEMWVNLNDIETPMALYDGRTGYYTTTPTIWASESSAGDGGVWAAYGNGSTNYVIKEGPATGDDAVFTVGQWHHVAMVRSGTTTRLYVDGNEKGTAVTTAVTLTNPAARPRIGQSGAVNNYALDGYIDEIRVSSVARYTGTGSGAFTPSTTAFTSDDDTELLIHSNFSGGIGADTSGNDNHWSVTNLAASDVVLDNPSAGSNFCVMNPLDISRGTLSEGNTKYTASTSTWGQVRSTFAASTGKWYWEATLTLVAELQATVVGILESNKLQVNTYWYNTSWGVSTNGNCYGAQDNNLKVSNGTQTSFTHGASTGSVYGFHLDLDSATPTLALSVDGVDKGTMFSGLAAVEYSPALNLYGDAGGQSVVDVNFGQGDPNGNNNYQDGNGKGNFKYEPDSGFLAWCTNSQTATIAKPAENFDTISYAGVSGTTKEVNGLDFTPALVWIKNRTSAAGWNVIFDSVRGGGQLSSNESDVELASGSNLAGYVSSYDADGFTVTEGGGVAPYLSTHETGDNYVAWSWKAGTSTASSYTYTLTLELEDTSGDGWGEGYYDTPRLEVIEGTTSLGYATVAASTATYTIETNNKDAIKIVWDYDDSSGGTNAGATYEQIAELKEGSTVLSDWDDSQEVTDGAVFHAQTTSTNESTTGTLAVDDGSGESYNAAAGFSIVKWTGDSDSGGYAQEVTHSLGVAPELIIAKNRTDNVGGNGNWMVYHKSLDSGDLIKLNTTGAAFTPDSYTVISGVTATKVDFDNDDIDYDYLNYGGEMADDDTYIAYLFASKAGYSKVGSYEGTGSSSSLPFIYTGFRPAFVMLKNADNGGVHWNIHDATRSPSNVAEDRLSPNESNAEDTGWDEMEFFSNGFRPAVGDAGNNGSGETIIYLALAESPLKYANAR